MVFHFFKSSRKGRKSEIVSSGSFNVNIHQIGIYNIVELDSSTLSKQHLSEILKGLPSPTERVRFLEAYFGADLEGR